MLKEGINHQRQFLRNHCLCLVRDFLVSSQRRSDIEIGNPGIPIIQKGRGLPPKTS